MFTIEKIKAAHSKVKSGADFPKYIQEVKALGVTYYEAYVADGHVIYYGTNDHTVKAPVIYQPLDIADNCNDDTQFKNRFKSTSKRQDRLSNIL
jgi:uncharacterized protein YbcV (DUF1398 family)